MRMIRMPEGSARSRSVWPERCDFPFFDRSGNKSCPQLLALLAAHEAASMDEESMIRVRRIEIGRPTCGVRRVGEPGGACRLKQLRHQLQQLRVLAGLGGHRIGERQRSHLEGGEVLRWRLFV